MISLCRLIFVGLRGYVHIGDENILCRFQLSVIVNGRIVKMTRLHIDDRTPISKKTSAS